MGQHLCKPLCPPGLTEEETSEPPSQSPEELSVLMGVLPAFLAHTCLFKSSHQTVSIVLLDRMEDGIVG